MEKDNEHKNEQDKITNLDYISEFFDLKMKKFILQEDKNKLLATRLTVNLSNYFEYVLATYLGITDSNNETFGLGQSVTKGTTILRNYYPFSRLKNDDDVEYIIDAIERFSEHGHDFNKKRIELVHYISDGNIKGTFDNKKKLSTRTVTELLNELQEEEEHKVVNKHQLNFNIEKFISEVKYYAKHFKTAIFGLTRDEYVQQNLRNISQKISVNDYKYKKLYLYYKDIVEYKLYKLRKEGKK